MSTTARPAVAVAGLRKGYGDTVVLGLATRSVETASNLPMPLMLLPFLGSGFVPTRSMPGGLRWFADHQPFTPIMDTVRGLLLGARVGSNAIVGVAWCVTIAIAAFVRAQTLDNRDPTAEAGMPV